MHQSSASIFIQPLSTEQQQQVIKHTHAYINQAIDLFNIKNKPVEISFNLKGRSAGMYRVKQHIIHQKREIRYNSHIFSKYFDDNFKTTVPHEVAHYISDVIYGLKNIKPHGKEWKEIMRAFDADASVTANYDLSGIPQKNKTLYTYQCSCREHQLGPVRHNRIKKNRNQYQCSYCKKILHFKQ
jgi:SprT protein